MASATFSRPRPHPSMITRMTFFLVDIKGALFYSFAAKVGDKRLASSPKRGILMHQRQFGIDLGLGRMTNILLYEKRAGKICQGRGDVGCSLRARAGFFPPCVYAG